MLRWADNDECVVRGAPGDGGEGFLSGRRIGPRTYLLRMHFLRRLKNEVMGLVYPAPCTYRRGGVSLRGSHSIVRMINGRGG